MLSDMPCAFPPQALSCAAVWASAAEGPAPRRQTIRPSNSRQTSELTSARATLPYTTYPTNSSTPRMTIHLPFTVTSMEREKSAGRSPGAREEVLELGGAQGGEIRLRRHLHRPHRAVRLLCEHECQNVRLDPARLLDP